MSLQAFIEKIETSPESISFDETMSVIDNHYDFTPTEFSNGDQLNGENENNGSCKIFAFAKINQLSEQQTLHCFGNYYRKDVAENPDGDDHQNIRNFIRHGWDGIKFKSDALSEK